MDVNIIKLTNENDGEIYLVAHNIVSFEKTKYTKGGEYRGDDFEIKKGSKVETVNGAHIVKETPKEILALL